MPRYSMQSRFFGNHEMDERHKKMRDSDYFVSFVVFVVLYLLISSARLLAVVSVLTVCSCSCFRLLAFPHGRVEVEDGLADHGHCCQFDAVQLLARFAVTQTE